MRACELKLHHFSPQPLRIPVQLIVWAFDLLPAGVPRTYPELGRAAAGQHGVRAVMALSFLELFGGSCILLMVAWRMAELLLPPGGWAAYPGARLRIAGCRDVLRSTAPSFCFCCPLGGSQGVPVPTFLDCAGLGPLNARQLAAAVVSGLLLPILFVDIRRGLSRLAVVGLSSCLLVIAMTLALLVLDPRRAALPQQVWQGDRWQGPGRMRACSTCAAA